MLLDSKQLNFYKWDGDVQVLLDSVRRKINELSEGWSEQQKEHCLAETMASFKVCSKQTFDPLWLNADSWLF